MGRFVSEDPIKDGLNWYVYTNNNPVMFTDPSGLAVRPQEPVFPVYTNPIVGYIIAQNHKQVENLKLYKAPISEVGCEVVAIHNALCSVNKGVDFRHVLQTCKNITFLPDSGKLGCNPYRLGEVLNEFGVSYKSTTKLSEADGLAATGGTFIISFLNENALENGLHTVMFRVEADGSVTAYNTTGEDTEIHTYTSFEKFKYYVMQDNENFLILYRLEE